MMAAPVLVNVFGKTLATLFEVIEMTKKQQAAEACIAVLESRFPLTSRDEIDTAVVTLADEFAKWLQRIRLGNAIFDGFEGPAGDAALAAVRVEAKSDIPQFDFTNPKRAPQEFYRFVKCPGVNVVHDIMEVVYNWRLRKLHEIESLT